MITKQGLKDAGYEAKTFFFVNGGGADEGSCEIWVKGNAALRISDGSCFCYPHDQLTYRDGFPNIYEIRQMDDIKAIIK